VEGRIEYSQTEGEGGTKYWTDVVIQEMVMLGSTGGGGGSFSGGDGYSGGGGAGGFDGGGAPSGGAPSGSGQPNMTDPDDDLPF